MAISAQHIVAFTRHSVSGPSQLCWTVLRGGISRLLPALIALWTSLPELLHILTSKVKVLEYQSQYIGCEKSAEDVQPSANSDDECLVTCEVLYSPGDEREMDIIFIHGLHGSTVKTWRQGDWNFKYQEVQRIPLRENNTMNSANQGVCPHCHLVKTQMRKSFCDLNDMKRVHRTVPLRSFSVPNGVYRSPTNNITKYDSYIDEEHSEELSDSDEDILSFLVGDLKENSKSEYSEVVDNLNDENFFHFPLDLENESMLKNKKEMCSDSDNEILSEESMCDIRIDNISDNLLDENRNRNYDSLAFDDCDINFINDYMAESLHNMRAMCDSCSSKCQNDYLNNDCSKCLKIESLLIDNIGTNDPTTISSNLKKLIVDEELITSKLKRKYENVNNDFNNVDCHVKLRKLEFTDDIKNNSFDEYADAENDFSNLIGVKNEFVNISNDNLNNLTLQLSDDSNVHSNNVTHSQNNDCCVEESFVEKQYCTCDKNSRNNSIKMKRDEKSKNEPLSSCWPKDWLPLDYPGARIISISYTTDQNLWRPIWIKPYSRTSLKHRSSEMVQKLAAMGVGDKPVIWVGHSKGGLFIKEIFSSGFESSVSEEKQIEFERIYNNTKALVLYSVPHRGSPLANITFPPLLRVSSELEEIQHESDFVLKLHERFLSALDKGNVDPAILSYCETRRTLMGAIYLTIVSTHSADPGVGHLYYGVSLDHREICKPTSRSCFIYKELLSVIEHIYSSILEEECN